MVGFCDLVGVGIAPVSKIIAVKKNQKIKTSFLVLNSFNAGRSRLVPVVVVVLAEHC